MGIPILKTNKISWDGLYITIYFSEEISEEIEQELRNLVNSWYTLGTYQAFEGVMHDLSEIWSEEGQFGFCVDMGSAGQIALDILLLTFESFAEIHDIIIDKIVIGMVDE